MTPQYIDPQTGRAVEITDPRTLATTADRIAAAPHSHEYTTWRERGPQHCKVCGRVQS